MATINEILTEVDELKPNQYDDGIKIGWISNIEYRIIHDIFESHEPQLDAEGKPIEIDFNGYTESDMSATLLVPDPYSELYKYYLFAMIDFTNGETDRYMNSMAMYNNAYQTFSNYWNNNHMPYGTWIKL